MEGRPKNITFASGLAMIGAIFVLMATILGLDLRDENMAAMIGCCLLSLLLFLAICGSLYTNGQWSWRFLIFMEVMCTAVPLISFLFGMMQFMFSVTLVAISCIIIGLTTTKEAKRWVEADRV
jgi:cytochrome bd-type quinol oxidase subunit 2